MKKTNTFRLVSVVLSITILCCTVGFLSTIAADSDIDKIVELRIVQDHPGVPGYDAHYQFRAYYGTSDDLELLDTSEYTLSTDVPEVQIEDDAMTVPASFKDSTDLEGFKVYATLNSNKKKVGYYPMTIKKWNMTFSDEFDGDQLDASKWTPDGEEGSSQGEYNAANDIGGGKTCAASPDAVSVEDGKLVLKVIDGQNARINNQGTAITADFASSNISTYNKFSQHLGCFSASIKFANNKQAGLNTAFWLLPSSGGWGKAFFYTQRNGAFADKLCGEIDIEEYSPSWDVAGVYQSQSTEHWWNADDLTKYSSGGENRYTGITDSVATGKFVNYSAVWTENALYTYIDGYLLKVVKNLEPINQEKAFIILGNYPGGYKTNSWTGKFDETLLGDMVSYVDYVHVYE